MVLGSSNDYCGVYNRTADDGTPLPVGPIWLGYYRSENAGASFVSSLVPGYPDDTSPYRALSEARTASSGDPVIAWDAQGRAFFGSESSDDPAGSPKTFGDVWVATYDNPGGPGGVRNNDGKRYRGTTVVAKGSSAPNLLGKFNDKTAIEADHNADGRCSNDVYFAYSRFTGARGGVGIYFSRSTNHGASFTHPSKLSQGISDVQFADIAVTGNSNVYVFFRSFASGRGSEGDTIYYARSTDCGATFGKARLLQSFIPYDAQDVSDPEEPPAQSRPDDPAGEEEPAEAGDARDCGDFAAHCESGYTFFRRDTQVRATADQFDTAHPDRVYAVYDATKPGTQTPTGTTYGSIESGVGSQSAIFFLRVAGATGTKTGPTLIDNQATGHQTFPDISADNPTVASRGTVHAIWWDSRLDPCYSRTRPIGNCADRSTVPSLDAWGARSDNFGGSWTTAAGSATRRRTRTTSSSRIALCPSPATTCTSPRSTTSPTGSGRTGATRSRAPTRGRARATRTAAAPTSSSAAASRTARGAATRARAPAGSTRTSTATKRHSDLRQGRPSWGALGTSRSHAPRMPARVSPIGAKEHSQTAVPD